MTEQVSGPQGTKIAGCHMVMIPKGELKQELKTEPKRGGLIEH